jgi:alpha-D-xyloside xylohydrolase
MSSFEHLTEYVKVGLNLAMSGIPWGASEIGGFITPDHESDRFHELMIRWYQYGVFCPVFRTHGYRPTNEPWNLGGNTYPHIRAAIFLRERLRPYVMHQMKLASAKGLPPMRPLFFDFADDPQTATIEDQFLFGPDILVAPVTTYAARSRQVYLPTGLEWLYAWSGEKKEGGTFVVADAPIEHIPVYIRASAPHLLEHFKDLYSC